MKIHKETRVRLVRAANRAARTARTEESAEVTLRLLEAVEDLLQDVDAPEKLFKSLMEPIGLLARRLGPPRSSSDESAVNDDHYPTAA